MREAGAQVIFSSVFLGAESDIEKHRWTQSTNAWLRDWCCCQNFGFFDNGMAYVELGLLDSDEINLSQRRKRVLGQELARLIDRALN